MTTLSKISIAQISLHVGGIDRNMEAISRAWGDAQAEGADIVLFPELAVTGYPAEDLLLRADFIDNAQGAISRLAERHKDSGCAAIIGAPLRGEEGLYNAALMLHEGAITPVAYKRNLPHYDVFDETRFFMSGDAPGVFTHKGCRISLLICEDFWDDDTAYAVGGADIVIAINASPFEKGKVAKRVARAGDVARRADAPLIYLNPSYGQDDLVFDGHSFAVDRAGQLVMMCDAHPVISYFSPGEEVAGDMADIGDDRRQIYEAATLGLRDYVLRNGFSSVLLGLSGGIDSALCAVMAADALGRDKVSAVMLPSPFTSAQSMQDAQGLAENLGIAYSVTPISHMMEAAHRALHDTELAPLAMENLQARIRGMLLMTISNSTGAMLLSTGNKSEIAVGYCTLYGDMCGGYNPIKDVYKTDVYALSHWRNEAGAVIPRSILTKAPTAELREGQKDEDSLPPYDILDEILYMLIECDKTPEYITTQGFDEEVVRHVDRLVRSSEHKRRQAAIGPKLSSRPFGRGRRYPVTCV